MYNLTHFSDYLLGALGASTIVVVLIAAFEYGHAITLI